jgi:hypothetical protein
MHDAKLYLGARIHRLDRFRKSMNADMLNEILLLVCVS